MRMGLLGMCRKNVNFSLEAAQSGRVSMYDTYTVYTFFFALSSEASHPLE